MRGATCTSFFNIRVNLSLFILFGANFCYNKETNRWRISDLKNAIKEWKHVFKLDPAKVISDANLQRICESGTDAIIVGGTDNVTLDGVLDLLYRVRKYHVPCVLEVSEIDAISPGFDMYFIPLVLNSTEKKWVMDIHHKAVKQYKDFLEWDEMVMEGYCILNPEAKAFQKTNCSLPSDEDAIAYAHMAEHVFKLPIFYVEYSGTFGDPQLLEKVSRELSETILFYGGGIKTVAEAKLMKRYANVIVVGNSLYTDFDEALATVEAVKEV